MQSRVPSARDGVIKATRPLNINLIPLYPCQFAIQRKTIHHSTTVVHRRRLSTVIHPPSSIAAVCRPVVHRRRLSTVVHRPPRENNKVHTKEREREITGMCEWWQPQHGHHQTHQSVRNASGEERNSSHNPLRLVERDGWKY